MLSKLLELIKSKQSEIVLAISMILIAIIAFEGGRISAMRQLDDPLEINNVPATIINLESLPKNGPDINQNPYLPAGRLDLRVVASKNSILYHFFWCSGATRIKEENKIIFTSEQEAQKRGYKLASNCQK